MNSRPTVGAYAKKGGGTNQVVVVDDLGNEHVILERGKNETPIVSASSTHAIITFEEANTEKLMYDFKTGQLRGI